MGTFILPTVHMPFNRAVTNLDWSPHSQEIFLCGYGGGEGRWDPDFPNGIVNIFSTITPDFPEITLKCQSEITSVAFHPYEPSIILGGTDSGYLVKWDLRTKKQFPIMKSLQSCSNIIRQISVVSQ
jgi:WD40 repeat protein